MIKDLLIPYASDEAVVDTAVAVRLEQIIPATTKKFASLADLYRAWTLASSGISSRTYRVGDCPVEFDGNIVRFFLSFYTWPTDPNLQYKITTTLGEVSEPQEINLTREYFDFADNVQSIDLPYYLEDAELNWETPTYNKYGERIPAPEITNNHNSIALSSEVFGGLQIKGTAIGDYYVVTIEIEKEQWEPVEEEPSTVVSDVIIVTDLSPERLNASSITNIKCTVTASWTNETGGVETEQLALAIPQCVLDVLSYCPGDEIMYYLQWCEEVANRKVYYSTCDGKVLAVFDGVNPKTYCAKIPMEKDPGDWLRSLM